ncbi:MAG: hypothetical protein WCH46_08975 [bacterium]
MKNRIFLILPVVLLIAGCLPDAIDGPQIVPRVVYQPDALYYRCLTGTQNLEIRWNPPASDTQQNFKGYYAILYLSDASSSFGSSNAIDTVFLPPLDSIHVPKTDTSCIFSGKVTQGGRYTARVWGERYEDPKHPDSLVLSQYPVELSFYFDSRAVLAPTEMYASSASGSNLVNIFWSPSSSEIAKQIGLAGYIIRYKDPNNKAAPLTYFSRIPSVSTDSQLIDRKYYSAIIAVPLGTSLPAEKEYTFWIKAIRKDSVESADSIGITWSGAERFSFAPKIDTGIFMGGVGFGYNIIQTVTNDPTHSKPQLQFSHSNDSIIVHALNGTKFFKTIEQDFATPPVKSFLDRTHYTTPPKASDFTESQVGFSNSSNEKGTIIYALLGGVNPARVLIVKGDTTGTSIGYVRSDQTIQIQASFQPLEPSQLMYW